MLNFEGNECNDDVAGGLGDLQDEELADPHEGDFSMKNEDDKLAKECSTTGALPANVPAAALSNFSMDNGAPKRKRGRPKGSKNKQISGMSSVQKTSDGQCSGIKNISNELQQSESDVDDIIKEC